MAFVFRVRQSPPSDLRQLFSAGYRPGAITHLAEYALGTEPRESAGNPRAVLVEKEGQHYLSFQFNRRMDPALSVMVEVSGTVEGGYTSEASILEIFPPVELGNGFEELRFDDKVARSETQRRFKRVRWTLETK